MLIKEDELAHYGILRRSGRYPWGSGGPEVASNQGFLGFIEHLKQQGFTEKQIADAVGGTIAGLRAAKSIARNEIRQGDIALATRLKDKGYSNIEIGRRMGRNESSVRSLLAPALKDRADVLQATATMLKGEVDKKKYLDVGLGVENLIGISNTKLKTAVAVLKEEGYELHRLEIPQLGAPGKYTTLNVLTKPDITKSEVIRNREDIALPGNFTKDGGRSYLAIQDPLPIHPDRVGIRYAEQGGKAMDGVIYVRPGVKDVSIGSDRYAQVRIQVGDKHYIKGMAMYKDDLPPGVDLVFNTDKHDTGNKFDALKSTSDIKGNPFKSVVRQLQENGKVTSVMNIVGLKEGSGVEGSWDKWSVGLSSQFLSKQSPSLAKKQLDMTYERQKAEFDEIMRLTNPTIRKKLLESFADGADSSAVHLMAAALPRTANRVILPINSLKENEVYSPSHNNGETVVLIRHPHGGPFELPELTVNNKNPEARRLLGTGPKLDAIGIHAKVAERLSGADFDGDTVLVVPNNQGRIKTMAPLEGLKGFDAKHSFPEYPGMKIMTGAAKQNEMGKITNLITDMSIRGANTEELARAVRHSMVVIDAENHRLNYKESARVNGIAALQKKYQGTKTDSKRTLLSLAGSRTDVPRRRLQRAKEGGPIDPHTGRKMFVPTGETRINKAGKRVPVTFESTKLAETHDAFTLSSGTHMESIYATHSNKLKALANEARKALVSTKPLVYSPSASTVYHKEVTSLNAKLNLAQKNRPFERQAQLLGSAIVSAKRRAYPDMEPSELKKIKGQALVEARTRVQAGKKRIEITDSEWKAIQAGAISNHRLTQILQNADLDVVKKLATPKTDVLMTSTKISRAKDMARLGYTQAEIAGALGVSLTTLKVAIGGG